jgi:hypothetical protein
VYETDGVSLWSFDLECKRRVPEFQCVFPHFVFVVLPLVEHPSTAIAGKYDGPAEIVGRIEAFLEHVLVIPDDSENVRIPSPDECGQRFRSSINEVSEEDEFVLRRIVFEFLQPVFEKLETSVNVTDKENPAGDL